METIPQKVIREALANAIVHREWDNSACIRVASYSDRLEITSPGGLPAKISAEDYLHGNISCLRNPTIGGVFYRLRVIEQFGTGILRIHEAYSANMVKPSVRIFPNTITVVLPKLQSLARLSEEEASVYQALGTNSSLNRAELEHALGLGKAKLIRILNSLIDQSIIERIGSGPSVRYRRKQAHSAAISMMIVLSLQTICNDNAIIAKRSAKSGDIPVFSPEMRAEKPEVCLSTPESDAATATINVFRSIADDNAG